ncbi:MAG: hypothetical protein S4CHLAM45_06430 [Chlamydiales bacterium]|nr:hypothetical protein [Chlamydiales bacterium]MCH9619817.1 hypothetical protein [Chlamydiales bacterium]MCH9622756.1 hypothetical protein [Chlamydiales bacterium]
MHIDIITRNRWVYTYENYATRQLLPELRELGVSTRYLPISDGDLFQTLLNDPPDWILCFNNATEFPKPIGDFIRLPTFHWESQELGLAATILESSHGRLGYFDPAVDYPNVSFLPHGVDEKLKGEKVRPFDVSHFGDFIDLQNQSVTWRQLFEKDAIDAILDETLPRPESISLGDLMIAREMMQKAKMVQGLISKTSFPLHLFGEHVGQNLFSRLPSTVSLHAPHCYLESLYLLGQSKIYVSDQRGEGVDRWFLPAIFSDCLVLTNKTPLLEQMIGNQFDIFYPKHDWEALDERVTYFLDHPKEREKVVCGLKKKLAKSHNWEIRAKQLIQLMEQT